MSDAKPSVDRLPSSSAGIAGMGVSEVELPSHFIIKRELGVFELSWRWRTHAKPSVFITSALPGFGVGGFAAYFPDTAFAIPLALVGLGTGVGAIGYQLARWGFNRVRLRAERRALHVEHGPLPWPSVTLEARDIAGLDVEEDGRRPQGWSVYVRSRSGTRQLLVGMLETVEQARFVEKCIEEQLQTDAQQAR